MTYQEFKGWFQARIAASTKEETTAAQEPVERIAVLSSLLESAEREVFLSLHDSHILDKLDEDAILSLYIFLAKDSVLSFNRLKLIVEMPDTEEIKATRAYKAFLRLKERHPRQVDLRVNHGKQTSIMVVDEQRFYLGDMDRYIYNFHSDVAKKIKEYNSIQTMDMNVDMSKFHDL